MSEQQKGNNFHSVWRKLKAEMGAYFLYLMSAVLLITVFFAGYRVANWQNDKKLQHQAQVQTALETLNQENLILQQAYNVQMIELEMDKSALKDAEESVKNMQQTLNEQQKELLFYRRIMAPDMPKNGVELDALTIISSPDKPHEYELELILVQRNTVKSMVKGTVNIELQGKQNDQPKTVNLKRFMLDSSPVSFGFNYFEIVNRSFLLPADFKPEKVLVGVDVFQFNRKIGEGFKSWQWHVKSFAHK